MYVLPSAANWHYGREEAQVPVENERTLVDPEQRHKYFSFLTRTNAAHIEVRSESACQPQTGDPAKERGHFRATQEERSTASDCRIGQQEYE